MNKFLFTYFLLSTAFSNSQKIELMHKVVQRSPHNSNLQIHEKI